MVGDVTVERGLRVDDRAGATALGAATAKSVSMAFSHELEV
jgi:hypothetical protein